MTADAYVAFCAEDVEQMPRRVPFSRRRAVSRSRGVQALHRRYRRGMEGRANAAISEVFPWATEVVARATGEAKAEPVGSTFRSDCRLPRCGACSRDVGQAGSLAAVNIRRPRPQSAFGVDHISVALSPAMKRTVEYIFGTVLSSVDWTTSTAGRGRTAPVCASRAGQPPYKTLLETLLDLRRRQDQACSHCRPPRTRAPGSRSAARRPNTLRTPHLQRPGPSVGRPADPVARRSQGRPAAASTSPPWHGRRTEFPRRAGRWPRFLDHVARPCRTGMVRPDPCSP